MSLRYRGEGGVVDSQKFPDAVEAGVACPVVLEATHEEALVACDIELLEAHAESAE